MLEVKTDKERISLTPVRRDKEENSLTFDLQDSSNKIWMTVERADNQLIIKEKDEDIIESKQSLEVKLNNLFLSMIEAEQSGTELTETEDENNNPFDPESINVNAKAFNLTLIYEMIKDGDIDLFPDFQRNLVWNSIQKSRLIESILLRIPLPMFYFSEDMEGRITIIDGLQRLTTIKDFMDNQFPLTKLEYLQETCGGRYFFDDGKKKGIDAKYLRWFKQTQFSVNVIAPSSPYNVKYDIFRRINTGGKPLNNKEIRNCLASSDLRNLLKEMAQSESFLSATDNGIKSVRMEDQDVALRFLLFYRLKEKNGDIQQYDGSMNSSLDALTEEMRRISKEEKEKYLNLYTSAMMNSEYLFGSKYAFRKIKKHNLQPNARRLLINKALFVCWSILLADYSPERVKQCNQPKALVRPLAEKIEEDEELHYYLSYGTNGRANLLHTLKYCEQIIKDNLEV